MMVGYENEILNKALDYLDDEYKQFRFYIQRQAYAPSIPSREDEMKMIKDCAKSTLDRGMGVMMFVQNLGVDYDDIKEPYEEFKTAVQNLEQIGLNDAKRL